MSKEITRQDKKIPVKFKPRARLLLQLGDQLIKNENIALIELVKNSYDADANHVNIYMENIDEPKDGIIIIEDDGYGMDADTVENVWMEPGSDFKTVKFEKREVSPKFNRLPIGEKGIGRFGVHKLGNQIEMTTKKKGSREVFLKIDWDTLNDYRYLDQVPVIILERSEPKIFKDGRTGTNIIIRNLRKEWTRGVARSVKRTITALVSPFDSDDSFIAEFDIVDKPAWFEGLLEWKDVKEFSLYHFRVVLRGNKIRKFQYQFVPWRTMQKLTERSVSTTDELVKEFLTLENQDEEKISLDDYNIGQVIFEGYVFDRDAFVLRLGVSDKTGFKNYLDNNCGIRVFRDGLRVYDYGEPENDWLGLDLRRVNQPTKRLSNNIVLGAIYLNRDESFDLVEKTNREGFVENAAYDVFRQSILHCMNIIETLRFSDKQKIRAVYGPTPKSEPVMQVLGDLKDYVEKNVDNGRVKKKIGDYLIQIEADYKRINENLLKAAGAGLSMSVVVHEVEKIILEVIKVLKKENASDRALGLIKHLSNLIDGYSQIIRKSAQTNEDIKEIVEQAITNTEFRCASHDIRIVRAYRNYTGKTRIKVARSLVIGTLMNLIDNSIYWMERAGGKNKKLYFDISDQEEGYITILVADNGPGFLLPTDEIIEPFVSAKPDGIGLGLHIASEIMLAQKGKLVFPEWGDFDLPQEFETGAIIGLSFNI